jgi:hypothetical protein
MWIKVGEIKCVVFVTEKIFWGEIWIYGWLLIETVQWVIDISIGGAICFEKI